MRQVFTLLFTGFISAWIANQASASETAISKITELRQRSKLELAVLEAERDAAGWHRMQIRRLYDKGFAAWSERQTSEIAFVAANATVESVKRSIQWLDNFESVAQSDENATLQSKVSAQSFVRNGGFRSVAWIPVQSIQSPHAPLRTPKPERQGLTKRITELRHENDRLSAALDHYDGMGDPYWTRKKLELGRIKAQLSLAEFESSHQERNPNDTKEVTVGAIYFDATFDDQLRLANSFARKLESDISTAKEVARCEFEIAKQRFEAMARLSERGFATAEELAAATAEYDAARKQIDRYRGHSEPSGASESDAAKFPEMSAAIVVSASALPHQYSLVRIRHDLEAQQVATTSRLDYLCERSQRLASIATDNKASRCEFAHIDCQIQLTRSLVAHAKHQCQMVSAEEYRFACQLIAQHRLERTLAASTKLPTGVQIIPDLSTAAAIGIVGMHPAISVDAWRFGYVESFYQLDDLTKYPGTTACDLTGIGSPAAWLAGNRPRGLDNSRARDPFDMRRPLNGLVSYRNAVPFHLSDLLHTPDLIDHSSNRIVTVNRLSSRLPSYSQNYAFGIRRLDGSNRSLPRANAYGGPWYLPGASTNYR